MHLTVYALKERACESCVVHIMLDQILLHLRKRKEMDGLIKKQCTNRLIVLYDRYVPLRKRTKESEFSYEAAFEYINAHFDDARLFQMDSILFKLRYGHE